MNQRNSYEFQGDKLRLIRELQLLTLSELSKSLDVSLQAISMWESNKKKPTFENILKLEDVLNIPRSFFFQSEVELPENTGASFFRKGAAVSKKYQIQVERVVDLFSLVEKRINKEVPLPNEISEMKLNFEDFTQIDFEEIENLAERVRIKFSLGDGPISNMTLLCEKIGARVLFYNIESNKIDALTKKIDDKFYIIINKERTSSTRIRFNLAHELGHILLHSSYNQSILNNSSHNKRIEAEANFFAGCLLLPEDGFSLDLAYSNLSYLISLKKHWKVSIQAIIYRGEQLGLITNQHALHLRQQMSRNKWRKVEPLDNEIEIELPRLLITALDYIEKESQDKLSRIIFDTGLGKNYFFKLLDYKNKEVNNQTTPKLKLL
ncbi:MAG: ImmA/IrrE family metallo-endopeptidase [Methanobrevibacter sp.]|nr:ImmA/IrrE family metallo-endopeptidase [Methanobrevibacter sp.]